MTLPHSMSIVIDIGFSYDQYFFIYDKHLHPKILLYAPYNFSVCVYIYIYYIMYIIVLCDFLLNIFLFDFFHKKLDNNNKNLINIAVISIIKDMGCHWTSARMGRHFPIQSRTFSYRKQWIEQFNQWIYSSRSQTYPTNCRRLWFSCCSFSTNIWSYGGILYYTI